MLCLTNTLLDMGITYKNGIKPDMARLYDASNYFHPEFSYKADLARLLNTSEQVLTNWEARGVSDKGVLSACGKMPGLNATWLRSGEGQMLNFGSQKATEAPAPIDSDDGFVAIKRVDLKISAGVSGFGVEYLNGERSPIFFRRDWIDRKGYNPERLHAIPVSGQSMEPSLYDGDLVVINADDQKPVDSEVFAANYEGEVVIKRMVREAGNWWLSSDNPDKRKYPNKLCHEHCFIIGRIIYKQSERI